MHLLNFVNMLFAFGKLMVKLIVRFFLIEDNNDFEEGVVIMRPK